MLRAIWTSVLSGVGLFLLHSERYLTSGIFWIKMALVIALLANGLILQVAERDAREAPDDATASLDVWRRMRGSAFASTALWSLVAIFGVLVQGSR